MDLLKFSASSKPGVVQKPFGFGTGPDRPAQTAAALNLECEPNVYEDDLKPELRHKTKPAIN